MSDLQITDDTPIDDDDYIVRLRSPDGGLWVVRIPAEGWFANRNDDQEERPYGLNMVTGGHYS